jgi:hypothetical protein
MSVRSVLAACVTAVFAVTGCAGVADDGDTEESAAALRWQQREDLPVPGPIDRPMLDVERRFSLPVWDLRRYFDDVAGRRGIDLGSCYQYMIDVYDPAKGHKVPIAVTVCS